MERKGEGKRIFHGILKPIARNQIMRKKGFTLIELLIVASIFSVVALALYSAFNTGISTYRQIDSNLNTFESSRLAFSRIESDLKNSFSYSSANSMFKGSPDRLDFFSASSGLFLIKYTLTNGYLMREAYQNLEALQKNPQGQKLALCPDVEKIVFEYAYATNNPDNPFDWQDSWPKNGDISQQKTLPEAVRIKLTMLIRRRKQIKITAEFAKLVSFPSSEYSAKLFSGITPPTQP